MLCTIVGNTYSRNYVVERKCSKVGNNHYQLVPFKEDTSELIIRLFGLD